MRRAPTRGPVVVPAGNESGISLGTSGRGRLRVLSEWPGETGYALIEADHPAGEPVIRDHVHRRHDETFAVIDGRYTIRLGADIVDVGPGDFVYVPRGTPHTYLNRGPRPGRILNIISPGDGVELLAELGALAGTGAGEIEITSVQARHHTVPVPPLAAW